MLKMIIIENEEQIREFHEFQKRLYKNDKNFISPLFKDIENIFNTEKNKLYTNGKCERFLCVNAQNETVGKIAIFINENYAQEIPTGGIGFFDCIDDQETANFMFDFAKDWLQNFGIEAMDGSINFGERDQFWGVVIDGFSEPLYGMNYNFPYYQKLFENFGFKIYYEQLCFSRPIHAKVSKIFKLMHERHKKNPALTAKPLKKMFLRKFAKDFTEIYNAAWANHGEGKQIEFAKTLKMFKKMKPVLNDHISWFVYENDKPIAMWINIPDLNQWFKYLDGKMGWFQKLQFLWLKYFKKNTKMVGIVFGVIPEWQKTGIEGYMIWEGTQHIRKKTNFTETELQWIGDFNPKMIKIAENLDTKVTKKLATFRYLFDREKTFERHPEL